MARNKRRGNQEGSIFQRKDGRWVAQITYTQVDGTRKLVPQYFATQADARRALTSRKSKQDSHTLVISGKATVGAWLDVWLEEFVKPARSPATYCSYHRVLRLHLPDSIKSLSLTNLAPETLQRHLNAIAGAGHGRTAELLRAVLRSAFNKAIKLRRMEYNPALGTDPVAYTKRKMKPWTADQGQQFIAAAAEDRLGAMFVIALSLGLRMGETRGLKAADADLVARELHIRRSLSWVKMPGDRDARKRPGDEGEEHQGKWVEREPKQGSFRTLRITETIHRALVRHIARRENEAAAAGKNWKDSGYLFVSPTGAPLHGSNISEMFHALCDRAGVPSIRLHDTRHTCGTLLHVQGADPFVIKEILGHAQLSTTEIYTHVQVQVTGHALKGLETLFQTAAQPRDSDPATVKSTVEMDSGRLQ
jgi:integrase